MWVPIAVAAAIVAAGGIGVVFVADPEQSVPEGPRTLRYTIHEGASLGQGFGRTPEVMPRVLYVDIGDRVVIVNRDERLHVLGPFTVRPGETLTYEFTTRDNLRGASSFPFTQDLEVRVR